MNVDVGPTAPHQHSSHHRAMPIFLWGGAVPWFLAIAPLFPSIMALRPNNLTFLLSYLKELSSPSLSSPPYSPPPSLHHLVIPISPPTPE